LDAGGSDGGIRRLPDFGAAAAALVHAAGQRRLPRRYFRAFLAGLRRGKRRPGAFDYGRSAALLAAVYGLKIGDIANLTEPQLYAYEANAAEVLRLQGQGSAAELARILAVVFGKSGSR
jgi:hypothetical protein